MGISSDYAVPVQVNGFACRNCTDVDLAKKHIDPAHPKSGPFGVNADTDPTRSGEAERDKAVRLDGVLVGRELGAGRRPEPARSGARLDITA